MCLALLLPAPGWRYRSEYRDIKFGIIIIIIYVIMRRVLITQLSGVVRGGPAREARPSGPPSRGAAEPRGAV